jgi:cytochrome c5
VGRARTPLPRRRAAALGAGLAAWLCLGGVALAGPRIAFEHRAFDFGEVLQGKIVEHRFPFTNTGDAELVIQDATTPCGCTVVLPDKKNLAPGESGYLDVTYDSAARSGDVERIITVRSNDPVEPELELHVTARVDASQHEGFKSGETLFGEKCGKCHAVPARDDDGRPRTGQALYDAVCWFCHGKARQGKTAPPLGVFATSIDPELTRIIAVGQAGTEMPAFAKDQGGPLTAEQIASLVALLHTPPPPPPPPEAEPAPTPAMDNPNAPFFK